MAPKIPTQKDTYEGDCGQLETVDHILRTCPRLQHLIKISPELKLSEILGTRKGMQAAASFLQPHSEVNRSKVLDDKWTPPYVVFFFPKCFSDVAVNQWNDG